MLPTKSSFLIFDSLIVDVYKLLGDLSNSSKLVFGIAFSTFGTSSLFDV